MNKDSNNSLTVKEANAPTTTSKQIALELFLSIEGSSKKTNSIEEVKEEIGFRRNNIFLNISQVSLSCRRLLDVAYFIVAQPEDIEDLHEGKGYLTYEVDLSFFKWLMGYTSRNEANLKLLANEAQRSLLSVLKDTNNEKAVKEWASTQLLGETSVSRGKITFSVSNGLARMIKNPSHYHFLSLRFKFNSIHSRLLFDLLLTYKNEGDTGWIPLEDLKEALECNTSTYSAWKYVNLRVLKPAIKEINERAGFMVTITTRRERDSRRIGYVQFKIEDKVEALSPPMHHLKSLYMELKKEFGLNDVQLESIIQFNDTEEGIERIENAMEYTRFQIKNKGVNVKSPSSYLVTAVEKGLIVGELEKIQRVEVEDISFKPQSLKPRSTEVANPHSIEAEIEWELFQAKQGMGLFSFMSLFQKVETFKSFKKDEASLLRANEAGINLEAVTLLDTSSSEELSHLLGLYVSHLAESRPKGL